jgi:predicted TIM-barrel fold metal-dependent hydrolase
MGTPMIEQLFDTHAHIIADDPIAYPPSLMRGKTELPKIPYSFTVEQLRAHMDTHGVAKACLVQRAHIYGYDNSYVLDAARQDPARFAAVAVVDAQNPQTPHLLRRMVQHEGLKGARIASPHAGDLDTAWLNSPDSMKTWDMCAELSLPMAVILFRLHLAYVLPALQFIAERYPALPIVIDHVGVPHPSTYEAIWAKNLGYDFPIPGPPDYGIDFGLWRFETLRNVRLKFTEINLDRLADGKLDPAKFIRRLADQFGAERMVWGSDVGQSEAPYAEKAHMARESAALLSAEERAQFLFETADRLYFPRA